MRLRVVVTILAVLTLFTVGGVIFGIRELGRHLPSHVPNPLVAEECTATGSYEGTPEQVSLSPEQMANAATIAAVGITRKVPPRAIVVALAAAQQESKLFNLEGGDRDSVGLFQQRPSQGWGTREQILDPRYAAGQFYKALLKVKGWQDMRIADAAQKVQRSADGERYQRWAPSAQAMADAFVGTNSAALSCTITEDPSQRGPDAATALVSSLTLDWGKLDSLTRLDSGTGGPAEPSTAADGAPSGLVVSVAGTQAGWQYAHWLVAHAAAQSVKSVTFGNHVWTAKSGTWTTVTVDPTVAGAATRVVAEVYS
ncbi:MAG TPA: hypothetical protein VHA75_04450 [Rugosimonospora sp.]|nr:hypothetical protein [Rugosimonospora sp.]